MDMAYNSLVAFDFDYFDQVGTLASLRVNVSYNQIVELVDSPATTGVGRSGGAEHGSVYHSNIKILDLSHNNVTHIAGGFFKPAELSLTQLYLGYNQITNTTKNIFGNMPQLQWLDLSHNQIDEIDFDTFKNTRNLQVFQMSHNLLTDIPSNLFKSVHDLRVVDLSHNHLKELPNNLFPDDGLESLDLSHNLLMKIPIGALTNMAALTLCQLDLSHNNIASIHSIDLSSKFRSLSMLDLSYNKLFRLDDAAFTTLPHLSVLDLSHNEELKIMDRTFIGLHHSLISLGMDNVSLSTVPELPLPALRILRLAHNELPSIPQELAPNMSQLRHLDLSDNDLTNVPILTHSLIHLRWLSLAKNSIKQLTNSSFTRLSDDMAHLDIAQLDLHQFEHGTLDTLRALRSLRMSTYPSIALFNIPEVIDSVPNLRQLWIEAPEPRAATLDTSSDPQQGSGSVPMKSFSTDLSTEMMGELPHKLRNITFSGLGFTGLADTILQGVRSPLLHIALWNTSIGALPVAFFRHLGDARNVSVDVRYRNAKLTKLGNPSSQTVPTHAAGGGRKVFLTEVRVSGALFSCDCGIGWMEFWQRKKRQYFCHTQTWTEQTFGLNSWTPHFVRPQCMQIDDDMRQATCTNKNSQQLMEVLKADLECGWDSGSRGDANLGLVLVMVVLVTWFAGGNLRRG